MNKEIGVLFEMAYLPVAHKKQRLNGKDFIEVAFDLMDELRKQTKSEITLKEAAQTMVNCFNNLLNPQMSKNDCQDMVNLLVSNSPTTRAFIEANRNND